MVTNAQLQTQITTEVQARKDADVALNTKISNEVTARSTAVNSLDGRLDTVEPKLDASTTSITNISNTITVINNNVTNLASEITSIKTRLAALEAKVFPPVFTDLPGWKLAFSDDFSDRTIPFGSFASASTAQYGLLYSVDGKYLVNPSTWKDTSNGGQYDPNGISVHDGMLDCIYKTVNGVSRVTCLKPLPIGCDRYTAGITGPYRYLIRMKADKAAGYKAVIVNWATLASGGGAGDMLTYGEIDHPEADLDMVPKAFMHHYQGTSSSDQEYFAFPSTVTWTDWHDYVLEFYPGVKCSFYVDGVKVGESTTRVPNGSPFRINLQFETKTDAALPDPSVVGHTYVDRIGVWTGV